jgi:hypothetical protein
VGEPSQGKPPWGLPFSALLGPLFIFLLFSGAIYGLLSEVGLLRRFTDIDLTFLLYPLLTYCAIEMLGSILRLSIPADGRRLARLLVNGAGYAYLVYVLFHHAARVLEALQAEPVIAQSTDWLIPYVGRLELLDTFAILFVVGVIIARVPPFPRRKLTTDILSAGLSIAGFVLMGLAIREGFAVYASFYASLSDVGTILLIALIFVGAGIALRPFGEAPNPILAGIGQWVGRSQLRNFTLGGLLASYSLVVRPALFDTFTYAMILEWLLVVAIAWQLFSVLRKSIGEAYLMMPRPLPQDRWQRHEQRITQTHPEFLAYFTDIQREFLEESIKDRLLIHSAIVLWENGLKQPQIAQIVHPLLHHRDDPVPSPALPWEAQWVSRRNRRERQQILDTTMQLLSRVATEGSRIQLEVAP